MKMSDVIKELEADIKKFGDTYVLGYSYSNENHASSSYMTSPTRTKRDGTKAKMNLKEFRSWIKNNNLK